MDASADKRQVIAQCYHCGNKGPMAVISTHTAVSGSQNDEALEDPLKGAYLWELLRCPVCRMLSLRRFMSLPKSGSDKIVSEQKIVYPLNDFDHIEVPSKVRSAFESAIRVRQTDTGVCLLSLERTLKAVCADQKAKGKKLKAQMKYLCEKKVLPASSLQVRWVLKQLIKRSDSAAGSIDEPPELETIMAFTRALIHNLYVVPAQGRQIKKAYLQRLRGK